MNELREAIDRLVKTVHDIHSSDTGLNRDNAFHVALTDFLHDLQEPTLNVNIPVEGLQHQTGFPDNLHTIQELMKVSDVGASLRRAPENPHDENAIEVHVGAVQPTRIGFVPAWLAEQLAPAMDAGVILQAKVAAVVIDDATNQFEAAVVAREL